VSVHTPSSLPAGRRLSVALGARPTSFPEGADHVIGVLPGEGIGPEVIGVTLDVLEVVARHTPSRRFCVESGGKIGLPAQQESGRALSDEVIGFCADIFGRQGALLCGPGGGRFVYEMRNHFDLYCKFTPLRPLRALAETGPVRPGAKADVDIVMVRENTGGTYHGKWGTHREAGVETAYQNSEYRHDHVERILRTAVNLAAQAGRRASDQLLVGEGAG
jgi:3-isopropylmalate dehydrogenase